MKTTALAATGQGNDTVRVHVYNREGKLVGPVETAKVVLTDAQWKKKLTAGQYRVLRTQATETPFRGALLNNKKAGVYTCGGCGLPLFVSDTKFNSGTGWPSFFQAIAATNVTEREDNSGGDLRIEINCGRCDGHLGHVFDDGPPPTGKRFCLNSAALMFTPQEKVATLADPAAAKIVAAADAKPVGPTEMALANPTGQATAVFAGGCFWCTEAAFEQLKGVLNVESGYAGGTKETANYEDVSTGRTGHAEVIRVSYDPLQISFDQLLDVFFDAHDPTQRNAQGHDRGPQYRSAIFFADDDQKAVAERKIKKLNAAKAFPKPIVTTLEPLKAFYLAEAYHQDYASSHPWQPYILNDAVPKACKVRDKHPDLIKKKEDAAKQR